MESLLVSALQSELAHASSEGRTGQASWLIHKRLINTYCVEHSVRFCMLPVQSLLTHHSSAPVSAPSPPLLILAYVIFTVEMTIWTTGHFSIVLLFDSLSICKCTLSFPSTTLNTKTLFFSWYFLELKMTLWLIYGALKYCVLKVLHKTLVLKIFRERGQMTG